LPHQSPRCRPTHGDGREIQSEREQNAEISRMRIDGLVLLTNRSTDSRQRIILEFIEDALAAERSVEYDLR
jgi:hypothetical protein